MRKGGAERRDSRQKGTARAGLSSENQEERRGRTQQGAQHTVLEVTAGGNTSQAAAGVASTHAVPVWVRSEIQHL